MLDILLDAIDNNTTHTYLCGGMLQKGDQIVRRMERDALTKIGHKVYNPADQEFNDKEACAGVEDLPTTIVKNDTLGIFLADTIVMEPRSEGTLGSAIECGQILSCKDMSKMFLQIKDNPELIEKVCNHFINQKVYSHNTDIRRVDGINDNRWMNYGDHAYLAGVLKAITTEGNIYSPSFDYILDKLKTERL